MSTSPYSPGNLPRSARGRSPQDFRALLTTIKPPASEDELPTQAVLNDDLPAAHPDAHPHASPAQVRVGKLEPAGRFAPGELIAARFIVRRYIARGGMGEVYEVEDSLLQSVHVALKIIRPEIARDAGSARRFEQEVLLARKVTHPNLCPIYDIARSGDAAHPVLFLTMKLLSGETLLDRMQRQPALSAAESIAIARQLAEGLAALHAAGIVHRDIKPNNVMLDSSGPQLCVVIMDFGLARLHQPHESDRTVIAGTPAYMAPELLRGHSPTPAADFYALGVLLCELFANFDLKPGPGAKASLKKPAAANLPPGLFDAVRDLLATDPEQRILGFAHLQTALQITPALGQQSSAIDLRRRRWARLRITVLVCTLLFAILALIPAVRERIRGVLMASPEKHIAVLPLDDSGESPESQAVGDGLMASLTGKLSNLDSSNSSLWIIPASELRESKVTTPQAAMKEFGATIVVQGAYRTEPDGTHLQLSLIDPRKSRQIGFIDLNTRQMDLTSLENEAVASMVRLMNIHLRGQLKQTDAGTSQTGAYEDYLAGVGYFDRQDKAGNLDNAVASLKSAIQKDPRFALAYALLTQVYLLRYRLDSNPQWIHDADLTSRKAAETGPQLPEAYLALGQYQDMTGNREPAIEDYQHALSLDPRNVRAVQGIAHLSFGEGKLSEAEAAYRRAIDLRPGDWKTYNGLGNFYLSTGHPAKAADQFQHAIQLTPDNSWLYINLGIAYQEEGDPKLLPRAEEAIRRSLQLEPSFAGWSDLGNLYALQSRFNDAIPAYQLALNLNRQSPAVWANLAEAYDALHNETDAASARHQAIALYQKAIAINPQDPTDQSQIAPLYARDGQREESLRAIHISLAHAQTDPYVLFQAAEAYTLLGDRTNAVKTLQLALNKGLSVSEVRATPDMKDLLLDPSIKLPTRP